MTVNEYNKSVELFSDRVYRFILKSIRDIHKAEDIVQDSYEKLWKNAENVSFEKVKSYFCHRGHRAHRVKRFSREASTNDVLCALGAPGGKRHFILSSEELVC